MIVHAIYYAKETPGVTDEFHLSMYHGFSWRCSIAWPNAPARYINGGAQAPVQIARSGTLVPQLFFGACSLIVSLEIKEALSGLSNIDFAPVEFLRLFDLSFQKGSFDHLSDPNWETFMGEICSFDMGWYYVAQPDNPDLHAEIGEFYEVLVPAPKRFEQHYRNCQRLSLSTAQAMISQKLLEENPIIHARPGWVLNESAFELVSPYIDPHFISHLKLEIDFSRMFGSAVKIKILETS